VLALMVAISVRRMRLWPPGHGGPAHAGRVQAPFERAPGTWPRPSRRPHEDGHEWLVSLASVSKPRSSRAVDQVVAITHERTLR